MLQKWMMQCLSYDFSVICGFNRMEHHHTGNWIFRVTVTKILPDSWPPISVTRPCWILTCGILWEIQFTSLPSHRYMNSYKDVSGVLLLL